MGIICQSLTKVGRWVLWQSPSAAPGMVRGIPLIHAFSKDGDIKKAAAQNQGPSKGWRQRWSWGQVLLLPHQGCISYFHEQEWVRPQLSWTETVRPGSAHRALTTILKAIFFFFFLTVYRNSHLHCFMVEEVCLTYHKTRQHILEKGHKDVSNTVRDSNHSYR